MVVTRGKVCAVEAAGVLLTGHRALRPGDGAAARQQNKAKTTQAERDCWFFTEDRSDEWAEAVAKLDMNSPCFQLAKQENSRCDSKRKAVRLRKLPTPVLSGSGSRVSPQPHIVEHPCFNNQIETLSAMDCKWRRLARRICVGGECVAQKSLDAAQLGAMGRGEHRRKRLSRWRGVSSAVLVWRLLSLRRPVSAAELLPYLSAAGRDGDIAQASLIGVVNVLRHRHLPQCPVAVVRANHPRRRNTLCGIDDHGDVFKARRIAIRFSPLGSRLPKLTRWTAPPNLVHRKYSQRFSSRCKG